MRCRGPSLPFGATIQTSGSQTRVIPPNVAGVDAGDRHRLVVQTHECADDSGIGSKLLPERAADARCRRRVGRQRALQAEHAKPRRAHPARERSCPRPGVDSTCSDRVSPAREARCWRWSTGRRQSRRKPWRASRVVGVLRRTTAPRTVPVAVCAWMNRSEPGSADAGRPEQERVVGGEANHRRGDGDAQRERRRQGPAASACRTAAANTSGWTAARAHPRTRRHFAGRDRVEQGGRRPVHSAQARIPGDADLASHSARQSLPERLRHQAAGQRSRSSGGSSSAVSAAPATACPRAAAARSREPVAARSVGEREVTGAGQFVVSCGPGAARAARRPAPPTSRR